MPDTLQADRMVGVLRDTVVSLVRRDGPDLSARQLGVFLTVYLAEGPHTVRGLAAELNVSKPTLIKWSRQHQFEIANLRATETEALAEVVFGQRHERWRTLAGQLKKLEAELEKRDLEEIPASRLHAIAAALRAEINREFGRVHFSEACKDIPREEFIYDREEWSV